jgi:hypothetical protein
MMDRPLCIGCGANAPETNTTYTLISKQFGWRLARRTGPGGTLLVDWRCPACWKKLKVGMDVGRKVGGAVPLGRPVRP